MSMNISIKECDDKLIGAVRELLLDLGHTVSDEGTPLYINKSDNLTVTKANDGIFVTYLHTVEVFRALSMIERVYTTGVNISENAKYETLCYMADMSRNAVANIPELKRFIRTLATLGYNSLMLYTEDTFELPGYPYFGHMRGRYTTEELKEIDSYAYSFGIELIPCVQMLAHLIGAMRWPDFSDYKEDYDTLLVGDERTYAYVRAVLEQCRKCFRTNRIHIGMDEAVGLGRGQYLTKNGYRKTLDIFLEHTDRVMSLCREYGYKPMMWSDTMFRESFGRYYVKDAVDFDPEFVKAFPNDVDMVYWDYYHDDEVLLDNMMRLHVSTGCKTVFAGGGRKWDGFASNNHRSLVCSRTQLDFCEKYGIRDIIMTAWGDCTAEASIYAALPTTILFAERCYSEKSEREDLDVRCRECFGMAFDDLMQFDLLNLLPGKSQNVTNAAKYLLYNDPFERLMDMHMDRRTVSDTYKKHTEILRGLEGTRYGYAFRTLRLLSEVLEVKADLGWRIYDAYCAHNKTALSDIASGIPALIDKLGEFLTAFREQWYRENKTMGFATQELRIGGMKERLASVMLRLLDYVNGTIDRIEELEYAPLPEVVGCEDKYVHQPIFTKMYSAGIDE